MKEHPEPLILFDGVCNLCNGLVRFVAARDEKFRFAPLQSEVAEEILEDEEVEPGELETFVLIDDGEVYTRSDAAVKLLEMLGGRWKVIASFLALFPRPLRDLGYSAVARSRYRVFGRKDTCMVPEGDLSDRFVSNTS